MREMAESLEEGVGAPVVRLAQWLARDGRAPQALALVAVVARAKPEVAEALREHPGFASLRDDPRFLQMTGAL